jgi:hypothetical protein
MNNYKAFGLQISSELQLSGLLPHKGEADVTIRFGKVPEQLPGALKAEGILYQINKDSLLLKIPNVGKYLIKDGKEIVIEKYNGVTEDELCLFTINTPIGALLHQRGFFPLHASAVEIDDACVVFTGVSGAGKSSILTAFQKHGYRILTEEICSISLSENNIPYVHPGAAYTYLWSDVLAYFDIDSSKLKHRPNNPEKYKLPLDENFCDKRLPLKRIYILNTHNSPDIKIEELKGQDKILPIKNNSYRKRIGTSITNPIESFSNYSNIGKHVIIKQISRPKSKLCVEEIYESIIKDLKK